MAADAASSDRELVLTRVYDAPRELVWEAWTDRKHLDAWWGPNGFRNETSALHLAVGGEWRYVMHGPDGKDWQNWIRYEEVSAPSRLVYAHGDGASPEPHFHVTIMFSEEGGRTRVTMTSLFPSAEALAATLKFKVVVDGGQQTLARLAGYLPHLSDGSALASMVITRLLDAPVRRVFQAWTTPAQLARWWGPRHFTLPTAEVDFRPGGAYRLVMQDPAGHLYPFAGRYQEIIPERRIVFSAIIEGSGVEMLTTVSFSAEGEKTRLTVCQTTPSVLEMARGQREGWSGSLEKLDEALRAA